MERKRDILANLLLLFHLFWRCRAQVDNGGTDTTMIIAISLPFAIFFIVTVGICVLFWWCYCRVSMLAKQPHYHRRPRYVYNYPRPQQQNVHTPQNRATSNGQPHATINSNLSSGAQTRNDDPSTTSQSTALNPTPGAHTQTYSGQDYAPPSTVTAPSASLGAPTGTRTTSNSQTVPPGLATSETVSLPEAALHQGDAPPAYAEAIKMETVIAIDET